MTTSDRLLNFAEFHLLEAKKNSPPNDENANIYVDAFISQSASLLVIARALNEMSLSQLRSVFNPDESDR